MCNLVMVHLNLYFAKIYQDKSIENIALFLRGHIKMEGSE